MTPISAVLVGCLVMAGLVCGAAIALWSDSGEVRERQEADEE